MVEQITKKEFPLVLVDAKARTAEIIEGYGDGRGALRVRR